MIERDAIKDYLKGQEAGHSGVNEFYKLKLKFL
jgi:hypothetical protein